MEVSGHSSASLLIPLAIDGVVQGDLGLRGATPPHIAPQTGSAVLVEGKPVQRMSFLPTHAHSNPFRGDVPPALRGLTLPAGASRWYPWESNRRWPRSRIDNVDAGKIVEEALSDFDMALAWFAAKCHVIGELPKAPWMPRLV